MVENARDTERVRATTRNEREKLYFNKHFSILYVYDHLEIYAWILKEIYPNRRKHRGGGGGGGDSKAGIDFP